MRWDLYEAKFRSLAERQDVPKSKINSYLSYSKNLYDKKLPVIFDHTHLSLLIGINNDYLHRMSNAPKYFYRTFYIKKRNGKLRKIDEPLPDLKKVQSWILKEILYKIPCSKFAKAYIPKTSIKDNVRFHKKQNLILTIDVKDFFPSISSGYVLNLFLSCGYNLPTSVILTRLCCLKDCLPQGAPTSAYLSNLVLNKFDEAISDYCVKRNIRYTRYADDLTFSGFFDISALIHVVDKELKYLGLQRNPSKVKIMRAHNRQCVTGIIVNDVQQLSREYRMKIRQEVHFIEKFGLDDHLSHIGEQRINYIEHLSGKINYALSINPKDKQMQRYKDLIDKFKYQHNS